MESVNDQNSVDKMAFMDRLQKTHQPRTLKLLLQKWGMKSARAERPLIQDVVRPEHGQRTDKVLPFQLRRGECREVPPGEIN